MRHGVALLGFVILLMTPSAAAADVVQDVRHEPTEPQRGQDVIVTVVVQGDASIDRIHMVHCRVEPSYACSAKTSAMVESPQDVWTGVIPWTNQSRFFDGATWIGYNFFVTFDNGSEAKLPTENVPTTPAGLPADADRYYFYRLADAQDAPPIGLVAMLTALAFLLGGMRRRVHQA